MIWAGHLTLAIEVLSPPQHDRLTKYNLYEQAGVPEYWIVSPRSAPYRSAPWWMAAATVSRSSTRLRPWPSQHLSGCFIELSKVFLPDSEAALWTNGQCHLVNRVDLGRSRRDAGPAPGRPAQAGGGLNITG